MSYNKYIIYGALHQIVSNQLIEVIAVSQTGVVHAVEYIFDENATSYWQLENMARVRLGMIQGSTNYHKEYIMHSPVGHEVHTQWIFFNQTKYHAGLARALHLQRGTEKGLH